MTPSTTHDLKVGHSLESNNALHLDQYDELKHKLGVTMILNFTSRHKGVDTWNMRQLRQHSQKLRQDPTSFPIKKLRKTFMTTPRPPTCVIF